MSKLMLSDACCISVSDDQATLPFFVMDIYEETVSYGILFAYKLDLS